MAITSFFSRINFKDFKEHIKGSWSVSWPMIFIMIFEVLINLTDIYIAGRLGKEYQASIGFVSQIYMIFIVLANALTIGTVSILSRQFTSGETRRFSDSVYSIVVTIILSGCVLSLLGVFIAPAAIGVMKIPPELKDICKDLIIFLAGGMLFHYSIINSNGILRATRNVKKSLVTMAVVCVLNVGLTFLFVFYTPLGYKGITLSTAVSYFFGSIINFVHVAKFIDKARVFSIDLIKSVVSIGWPSGLHQILWTAGYTILFIIVGMIPENSVDVVAALTNGGRIESVIFMPAFAFALSSAVITGNFLGEKKEDSAFAAGIATAFTGVIFIILLIIIVILNAETFASFLSSNPNVINECKYYLYISMASEPFMIWSIVLSGSLNGAGDTKSVMLITVSGMWLIRLPLCYILAIWLNLGSHAIWWSMNASMFFQAILVTWRYFGKRWIKNALLD
ncbi:MAG: MATE family efflux transporter [Leptospirales bacterium]|nr:MATE family efflux transporter [Leptospirales bacterium]